MACGTHRCIVGNMESSTVLISLVGTTPAVLTETVWALATGEDLQRQGAENGCRNGCTLATV
jgi:hypothetical protein